MALEVKSSSANAGDSRDSGSIPGLRRSPRRGYSNPLQYSGLERPTDGESGRLGSRGLQRVGLE